MVTINVTRVFPTNFCEKCSSKNISLGKLTITCKSCWAQYPRTYSWVEDGNMVWLSREYSVYVERVLKRKNE